MVVCSPQQPSLPGICVFTIKVRPGEKLGLKVSSGGDDCVEISHVYPNGPASKANLHTGYEILSINNSHIVTDGKVCSDLFKRYSARGKEPVEIVASTGPRPLGSRYVLLKNTNYIDDESSMDIGNTDRAQAAPCNDPGDGSFRGAFLEERSGGRVRVNGFGMLGGTFVNSKVNVGDYLLSIDGRPVHSISDCRRAFDKSNRPLIAILTYNTFRKAKSAVAEEHLMSDAALAIPLVISTPPIMMNEIVELKKKQQSEKDKKRVISDLYNFGRTVGTGTYSIVKKCKLLKTGGIYAVKICNRSKMNPTLEHRLQDEILILSNLNHPNIIRFYDTFVSTNSYYLITEYLDGGELFDRIVEKHTYTEKEARDVCSIIFDAVNHCHMHRITHRDLKPENLLLLSRDNDTNLKIADFGFAKMTPSEDSLTTFCGSPMFVSPEILNKKPYGTKTDMWSIGVIIFCLLGGYSPFQHEDQKKQFDNIKCARYSLVDKYWHNITNEAKSLIRSLLTVDPLKRISAQAAMAHPWMKVESDRLRRTSLVLSQENLSFGYNSKTSSEGAIKSSIRMKAVDENSQVTSSMLAAVTAAAAAYSNDTLTEDDDAIPQNNITNDNDTVIAANVREGDKLYYEKGEQRTKVNVTVLKIHRDDFPNLYFTIKEDGSDQERQTVAERLKWNNDIVGRRVTDAVTNIQRAVRRRSAAKMTPVVQQQQQRSTTRSPRSPPPPTSSLCVVSTVPTRELRVSIDPPAHEAANIQRALRRPSNIKKIWL